MILDQINLAELLDEAKLVPYNAFNKKKVILIPSERYFITVYDQKYLIKAANGRDKDFINYFSKEIILRNWNNFNIQSNIPKLYYYNDKYLILIIEYILCKKSKNYENNILSEKLMEFLNDFQIMSKKGLYKKLPWIFDLQNNPNKKTLVDEALIKKIKTLKTTYKFNAVCHNDLKPQNTLFKNDNLFVVDWEMLAIGDNQWDYAYYWASQMIDHFGENPIIIILNEPIDKFHKNYVRLYFGYILDHLNEKLNFSKNKMFQFIGLALLQRLIEYTRKNKNVTEFVEFTFNFSMSLIYSPEIFYEDNN